MKKILFLLLLIPTLAMAASLPVKNGGNGLPESSPVLHFSNWTSTGQGTSYGPATNVFCKHRWIIDIGGTTPDNVNAKIKTRDSYNNWVVMDTYSTTSADTLETRWIFNKCGDTFRVDIDTFTNGSTITINSIHGGN